MAQAQDVTTEGGGASQPPGNVSLDSAIAYVTGFAESAAAVEGAVIAMRIIAASVSSQIAANNARMSEIESNLASLLKTVASLRKDDLHRPIGSDGNESQPISSGFNPG